MDSGFYTRAHSNANILLVGENPCRGTKVGFDPFLKLGHAVRVIEDVSHLPQFPCQDVDFIHLLPLELHSPLVKSFCLIRVHQDMHISTFQLQHTVPSLLYDRAFLPLCGIIAPYIALCQLFSHKKTPQPFWVRTFWVSLALHLLIILYAFKLLILLPFSLLFLRFPFSLLFLLDFVHVLICYFIHFLHGFILINFRSVFFRIVNSIPR